MIKAGFLYPGSDEYTAEEALAVTEKDWLSVYLRHRRGGGGKGIRKVERQKTWSQPLRQHPVNQGKF